jgi:uncharacterized protein DUF4953
MRRKSLQVAVMFALGLAAGAGYVLASHPWICSGSTAFHWGRRTVGVTSPTANTTVVRSASSYTSAFNGSRTLWDGTVINLVSGTQLRLNYGAYGTTGWLGLASLTSVSGCTINSARSQLNDTYLRDTSRYSQTAVNHVSCQEVGHTFGLNHNRNSSTTCMNDTILTAGNQINQHDRDQLASIYASIPN